MPPRDPIQAAHSVLAQLTGEEPRRLPREKDQNAVALGRKGGLKGGKSRMAALSGEERKELGRQAAEVRWRNHKPKE